MPATVLCHQISLALLPGATGRADAFRERRAEILESLRSATAGGELMPALTSVTVIAPGLATRHTRAGVPDVAAVGLDPSLASDQTSAGGAGDGDTLHVTASAAVELLRLAGWTREVAVIEFGADGPSDVDEALVLNDLEQSDASDLLLLAVATTDGLLPDGAPTALAGGERRVHAIRRALEGHVLEGAAEPAR